MFATLRRHASFANICSFLCLTIVLGMGTAYAKNTVRSSDIVNGQVKSVDLGNNAVTTGKIKDGQVTGPDLGANAVLSSTIVDGGVGSADLATGSVGADEIATDAVGATEISDGSIDGGEIIDESLRAADIGPGTIGTSELADSGVTGTDIASSTITGADVASNSIGLSDLVGTDISGSVSVPTSYVPIGQCRFLDISISGALADQTIIISAQATLPAGQLLYGVEVPSDGHGTMAACNFSGTAWDALTSFPVRVVTFG